MRFDKQYNDFVKLYYIKTEIFEKPLKKKTIDL